MNGDDEQDCQFVSSRGILKSCDVHPRQPVSSIRKFLHADYPPHWVGNLRPGGSVYVCTSAIPDFVANVFPRLPSSCPPFVLVTGDADELVPTDILPSVSAAAEFLASPRILAWFAQNCVAQHPKLFPLPVGLDYHTLAAGTKPAWGPQRTPAEQEADLRALRETPVTIRPPHLAYSNFHYSVLNKRFGNERRDAMAQIAQACVYYEPVETSRIESWRRQRLCHRFVLSPSGNGLDCHRTWEALCLGCIPIVRSTPLDTLWEGLSVWIVKSWSEVTEESLAAKAAAFDSQESSPPGGSSRIPDKLLLKTWMDKIRAAATGALT